MHHGFKHTKLQHCGTPVIPPCRPPPSEESTDLLLIVIPDIVSLNPFFSALTSFSSSIQRLRDYGG